MHKEDNVNNVIAMESENKEDTKIYIEVRVCNNAIRDTVAHFEVWPLVLYELSASSVLDTIP